MIDPGAGKSVGFTEIVGQEELKEALFAVAVSDGLDGLLIRGEKGTAKSTAVRALSELLPEQRVVSGCPYGCPPAGGVQCESCRGRSEPETTERAVPLVTLPLGATRERVVGTLSVADALDGDHSFDPGLLARANRGILYVDEVNLLDDHLVDVLLDVAASGVNRVERDGVSVAHPASFTLIGTMNPEEGDLRPQLRDRFALQATVTACEAIEDRVTIIDRAIGNDTGDPKADGRLRERLVRARERLEDVELSRDVTERIAELCRDVGVEGHRGDIATARAAMTVAALDGRTTVTDSDVRRAAELTLPHRLQSRPFEDAQPTDRIEDQFEPDEGSPTQDDDTAETDSQPDTQRPNGDATDGRNDGETTEGGDVEPTRTEESKTTATDTGSSPNSDAEGDTPLVPGQSRADIGESTTPELSVTDASDEVRSGSRARTTPSVDAEGVRVRTRRAGASHRIDAAASVRAAANRGASTVESQDLRHSVRQGEAGTLLVFVVDTSASMRPAMRVAKGTVLELLNDAYQHRDRVAFITVAGEQADVVLPPTDSVALAARHLKELPTGDRTPLPDGLRTASELLERADPDVSLVVIVSDGRANVANESPVEETRKAATRLADSTTHTLVVDAGDTRTGLTETITEITDGERIPLDALSVERIDEHPVRKFYNQA